VLGARRRVGGGRRRQPWRALAGQPGDAAALMRDVPRLLAGLSYGVHMACGASELVPGTRCPGRRDGPDGAAQ